LAQTALVTGISGQDGAYLAKHLLARGYRVVGCYRRTSGVELLEESNIRRVLERVKPDEIYNLAAQSFVGLSFEQPLYTSDVDALGV
jgi:GDPmannose 4,6-dehydratase